MNRQKALEWIGTHHVGISSRTLWCALMGVEPKKDCYATFDVPHDADDFSRCLDLVEFAEVTDEDLQGIPDVFPYWKPIIDIWRQLAEAYKAQDYRLVYGLLNDKYDEIMELKGFVKIKENHWVNRKVHEQVKEYKFTATGL